MLRHSLSLRFSEDRLELLDQTLLPFIEHWIDATDPAACIEAIQKLKVRGAPLLGVAAACSLAASRPADFEEVAMALRKARPTAVNLMVAVDRILACWQSKGEGALVEEACAIFDEDALLCHKMAEAGAVLIEDGENIITHCNTGSLATAGVGTALGVIKLAALQGKQLHIFVDETRPLLQGARLTTYELQKAGIPHTLITDSAAAFLMQQGRVSRVLVGADRIARNGDFANKIGTFSLALAAHYHQLPFHCVAPHTTLDLELATGADIPIELRAGSEISSHPEVSVWNPAFDITPARLVTSLILDTGVFRPEQLKLQPKQL
jgi:methylthioribose-1-phosphate isomerase